MYVKITDVHLLEVFQMQVFIYFLTAIVLLVVSGCANSKIQIRDDNQLIVSDANTTVQVMTPPLETKKINMGSVYVDQHIIAADEDQCIVYEDIRTAGAYKFNYSYQRSIDLIFNAYRVEKLKSYGNLTLYRVTLRDTKKSTINVLALTASKKSLKLVYGFDDNALSALEKSLDQNNTVIHYTLTSTTQRRDHCIQSSWQPKLLIMDNLVGKEGGGHIPARGL